MNPPPALFFLYNPRAPMSPNPCPVRPGRTVLGRSSKCALQVRDEGVSRTHAEIVCDQAGVTVTDLNSRNGTWVNGERVQTRRLAPGDCLGLGQVAMWLTTAAAADPVTGEIGSDRGTEEDKGGPPPGCEEAWERLTRGQRRVLAPLLEGLSDQEIAAWLGLELSTASHHVLAIFRAFEVHSRSELFALLLRVNGITRPLPKNDSAGLTRAGLREN